ncbi:hypothetical protein, partial [Pseudomonas fluorescens]
WVSLLSIGSICHVGMLTLQHHKTLWELACQRCRQLGLSG